MPARPELPPVPDAPALREPHDLRSYAQWVLGRPALVDKRRPPRDATGALLPDDEPGPPLRVAAPAREPGLELHGGADRLPRLGALRERSARAACLERFAHHELMAIELFAWGLLAFPDAPAALRRGFALALEEEQLHLALYLERLAAQGGRLGTRPLSGYLWRSGPPADEGSTLLGFLAAVGLTYEQANLDFTLLYKGAFRAAGDEETAQVIQRVHDDEIGHVRLAHTWFMRLKDPSSSSAAAYDAVVPFPLSAARAKGRRFDRGSRERAGLDAELIDHVERAQPYSRHEGPPVGPAEEPTA